MSVRQYVGARYVPRFSTINDGVWDNTYSYEALEIVKYGNDYYTSKIPVPAGVAITNTDYWVLTGNYNGAIATLDGKIMSLTDDVGNLTDLNTTDKTSIVNAINEIIKNGAKLITPEEFGAVGDGETDDTNAFIDAWNKAKTLKGGTILCTQNYKLNQLSLDGRDESSGTWLNINFICLGYLTITNQLIIERLADSYLCINTTGGGIGVLDHGNCIIRGLEHCDVRLHAMSVNDTAFIVGGERGVHISTFSVFGSNCMRTLLHGTDDTAFESQNFFGQYNYIYDYNPTYGLRFTRSSDITILHIENFFTDATFTKNMVEFSNCWSVSASNIAIGGKCLHAIESHNSQLVVSYLFMLNENNTRNGTAIKLTGSSMLDVNTLKGMNWEKLIYFENVTDTMSIRPRVLVSKILVENAGVGYTTDPSTIFEKDTSPTNVITCINGVTLIGTCTSAVGTFDYQSLNIVGDTITVNIGITLTQNVARYGTLVTFGLRSLVGLNFRGYKSDGSTVKVYQSYNSNELRNDEALTAGDTLTFCYSYPFRLLV